MKFEPRDPDYAARVRASFACQRVMRFIGAELVELGPGSCAIRLPCQPDLTQQDGFVHAGIVGTIADSAGGYAGFTLMPAEARVLTVEYKLNLLAPAVGDFLVARGEVIRHGRNLVVARADVTAHEDGGTRHCATLLQTLMTLHGNATAARAAGSGEPRP